MKGEKSIDRVHLLSFHWLEHSLIATPNSRSIENAALLYVQKDEKMGFGEYLAVSTIT